jgi:4-hydroxybenzoate polyprenyltransferase
VLRLLRPAQWLKNGIMLAALLFSKRALDPAAMEEVAVGIASFCLLASGVYAFNDVVDRARDRLHRVNRARPVASGAISPLTAIAIALAFWSLGLLLASRLPSTFLAIAMAYVANSIAYCLLLKRLVILDVMSIVFGFFLRVAGGAAAIDVAISHWLVICAISFSLFLAFTKRRAEMPKGEIYKEVLSFYTRPMIEQLIAVTAGLALLSYMLYTVAPETISKFGTDRLVFTVPFVIYGIFRYLYLAYKEQGGENPARALVTDVPSLVNGVLYVSSVLLVLYRR